MDNKVAETVKRPFIVEIDEAKSEIIQSINNAMQVHGLPLYLVDIILTDIYAQVKDGAKNELAMAKSQMVNSDITQGAT